MQERRQKHAGTKMHKCLVGQIDNLYQNIHCPQFAIMIHRYLKQLLIIRRDFKISNIL